MMARRLGIACGCIAAAAAPRPAHALALEFSTYLGGDAEEEGYGLARDVAGNLYITGHTFSMDFPGAGTAPAGLNGYVAKIDASGTALLWSAYVGGSSTDQLDALAIEADGGVDVAGSTVSTDFPTVRPVQAAMNGVRDIVVLRFDRDGGLAYSSYVGGSDFDAAFAAALDCQGNLLVAGETRSADLPGAGPPQPAPAGGYDGFVLVLDPTLATVVRSTYLGGIGDDSVNAIATDGVGDIDLLGATSSRDFPLNTPLQPAYGGGLTDTFVAQLRAGGSVLAWSTFFGGVGRDWASALGLGPDRSVYFTGITESADWPATAGAFQTRLGGSIDAYAVRVDADGHALRWATFLGGRDDDFAYGLAVDRAGDCYLTGGTRSVNFPVRDAQFPVLQGMTDAFFSHLSADGTTLIESTYYGGSDDDLGETATIDAAGRVVYAGFTESTAFPLAAPLQASYGGGINDVFLAGQAAPGSGPAAGPGVVLVRAVKAPLRSDVRFTWPDVTATNGYDVWQTSERMEIPDASQAGSPPLVLPVAGCVPAATASCVIAGGASGTGGEVRYFQVRGIYCAGFEGL